MARARVGAIRLVVAKVVAGLAVAAIPAVALAQAEPATVPVPTRDEL